MSMKEKLVELLNGTLSTEDVTASEQVADHLLANGVTVQEWVPANKPPQNEKPVLAYIGYPDSRIGFINTLSYYAYDSNPHWQYDGLLRDGQRVLAWMPMPNPPQDMKGGRDDG